MNRRETLKLLLLCAARPGRQALDGAPHAGRPRFESAWQDWPDMRWAGPAYWGNRLQDWTVRDGVLVCRVRARNRTLHCLTHRVAGASFTTRVSVNLPSLATAAADACVGFRLGAKGPFPDYRSATVFGTGLDAGVNREGHLVLGDRVSDTPLDLTQPIRLSVTARHVGQQVHLALTARTHDDAPVQAQLVRDDLAPGDLIGNLALLSHFDQPTATQPSALFSHWQIDGTGILEDHTAAFGPIMFAQYTVHRRTLKLTAQCAPINTIPGVRAMLEIRRGGRWVAAAQTSIDPQSRTAAFRAKGWDATEAVPYRVRLPIPLASGTTDFFYHGTIAAEPDAHAPVCAAVFSCNADYGFPDSEVVDHVQQHAPHMALFLGDQFYEPTGGFGIERNDLQEALLDMLAKWYMFGWSYRDLFRHIPSACIPDDHDVYHGNVWGEGGKKAPTDEGWGAAAQDQGGYKMPAVWVNAVQRAQTSHLPDPYDPTPVEQGIGVYYTCWDYGGLSFAILEDRKFKSAPRNVLPEEAEVRNGWIHNPDFDIRAYRDQQQEATLLGSRQMAFLDDWSTDWRGGAYLKVILSQTNFAAVHTIPQDAMDGSVLPSLPVPQPGEYVAGDKLAVDMDSNGWPQDQRDAALRLLRRCSAFQIAGDQHLATVVQNGIDAFDDAMFSFTVPALNNLWPRRWWPSPEQREASLPGGGPDYAGRFFDGFGNRITVHAAANPRDSGLEPKRIYDRVSGYGMVTFDKAREQIHLACWPRQAVPAEGDAGQFDGWPLTLHHMDGDGRAPVGFLPTIHVEGLADPVVEVRDTAGALVYTRRIVGQTAEQLPLFATARHSVRLGDPDRDLWQERTFAPDDAAPWRVRFG